MRACALLRDVLLSHDRTRAAPEGGAVADGGDGGMGAEFSGAEDADDAAAGIGAGGGDMVFNVVDHLSAVADGGGGFVVMEASVAARDDAGGSAPGLLLGLIGGLGLVLQADGLAHTSASTSAFLTQAYCVILPMWHCFSRRIAPEWRLVFCTGLVLWGISILSGFNWRTLHMGRGEWETLGAAAAFTLQIILLERPRYRVNRAMPVTLLMFLGFAAWSAPVAVMAAPQLGDLWRVVASPAAVAHLGVLALACTVFAYGIMNLWQPKVSATEAGLIYCIEPVCAAVYALFLPGILSRWTGVSYPNEILTSTLISGGLLITAANVLLQIKWNPKPLPPDP